mgnify:CR=1 FL=1
MKLAVDCAKEKNANEKYDLLFKEGLWGYVY